jgi:hypothetical protein
MCLLVSVHKTKDSSSEWINPSGKNLKEAMKTAQLNLKSFNEMAFGTSTVFDLNL